MGTIYGDALKSGGKFDFSGANVTVDDLPYDVYAWDANGQLVGRPFTNPLNTDQLIAGQHDVYFTAYPDIKWHVDHIDGDYVYLGLYNATETTAFGSNVIYSGSTIASKCTTYLNNTIPNVADYLEDVTVQGVTNKVFIPTYYQFSGQIESGDATVPVFSYLSTSKTNREACVSDWSSISNYFWLSTAYSSSYVWVVNFAGSFSNNLGNPSYTRGFRPEVKVRYK